MLSNDRGLDQLKEVECPDATYPARSPALIMHRALGSLVYDAEGRCYIDLCAGFGALALGHNPEPHQRVLTSRLSREDDIAPLITHGMGDVYASQAKVDLLTYLLGLLPPALSKAALALTGAQAVELAVKTALLATGRSRFIVFQGGYHGLDLGLLPLTDRQSFRTPFQDFCVADKVQVLPFHACAEELEAALHRRDVAAILVEPVQGRAGGRAATVDWLQRLRRLSERYGTLLIYDEVFTGLGRAGRLTFAQDVPCDLLCLGKALGGGFPVSACVGTAAAMNAWPASTGEALHTGTFFGHPLSCAAALATLQSLVADDLVARSARLGEWAKTWLQKRLADAAGVQEVRGQGLMLAIEFKRDGMGAVLMDALRAAGVIALVSGARGETLSVTPALNIPEEVLQDGLTQIVASIRALGES